MLPTPALVGAESAQELMERAAGEGGGRAAVRRVLVEDPVLLQERVAPADWVELRRRFGEEERYLDEMFGLLLEARAEGAAAIDTDGGCSDVSFPRAGTTAHAALLMLDALVARHRGGADLDVLDRELAALLERYGRYWWRDATADPEGLRTQLIGLLVGMGLVTADSDGRVTPRPVAARFRPVIDVDDADPDQGSLL